jgi:purine-binding chemotaxis protein CheW
MSDTVTKETDQYITIVLGEEHYAIEVSMVKEVLELQTITRMPKTPAFMSGVINVRGSVVPVIDLRTKFDMEPVEPTVDTCIVVVEVSTAMETGTEETGTEEDTITVGAIADKVEEVVEISPEDIEPPPRFGTNLDIEFIDGVGKYQDDFLIILDINKVFTMGEIQEIKKTGEAERSERSEEE